MKSTHLRAILKPLLVLAALACIITTRAQDSRAPAAYQVPAEKLSIYVGQYQYDDNPYNPLSVSLTGNKLFIESERSPHQEFLPQAPDTFSPANNPVPATFKFIIGEDGKVSGFLRIAADKSTRHAKKISDQPQVFDKPEFSRQEVMIPVRDGAKLHTVILTPKGATAPLPILMERTPYGVDGNDSDGTNARYSELVHDRYIFVFQDIRGRYKSEGTFVMSRAMVDHSNPKLFDESTDTYDTVDWLIKNIPNNNGRVGVLGISYPGFLAQAAGIDPHPAVKAISPQAPMIDVWLGDDFFHNGAFRQTYGYDYTLGMESSKENAFSKLDEDAYDFFLKSGSFAAAAQKTGVAKLPTAQGFLKNPAYDDYWHSRGVEYHLDRVAVPTLLVGGFWDQEDMFGPQEAYAALEPHDSAKENFLILGPWNHGQWGRNTDRLGAIPFGEPTTTEFRVRYEAPFFAHYLHDNPSLPMQDTVTFESGSDHWKQYSHWPPPESQTRNLFLLPDGTLAMTDPGKAVLRPAADSESANASAPTKNFTEYISDPANPIPYRHRPIEATYSDNSHWYTWMVEDQRTLLEGRHDYASWSTPVLDHDVTIAGNVLADLFAATSGTDSDWVVKLIDEYPATPTAAAAATSTDPTADAIPNFQLIINAEIFRGRYRHSFDHPEPVPANLPQEYKFSLHAADHTFLKGHKIVVQIQSTWFPLYDRNPQTYVANIMEAKPSDFRAATQRIYANSHLVLPILPATAASDAPRGVFAANADIGTVLHPGSAAFDPATSTYTLSGSGENIWFDHDAFHFVWKKISGDAILTADPVFLGAGANPHRKAVLMIRQTLDPDSPYVDIALHGDGLTSLQYRDETGAATHEIQSNLSAPQTLQLEKRGDYFSMLLAPRNGDLEVAGGSIRVAIHGDYYIGIGISSHEKDLVEKAVFSKVSYRQPETRTATPTLQSTLETINIASTDRRVLYTAPGRFEAPNWSRDGSYLVFNRNGSLEKISATGGAPEKIDLAFASRCNNDHGISPDGKWLAISDQSQDDHKSSVYVVPISGGTPKRITKFSPSYWHGWSPDGKTLAFVGERNGNFDIYTIPISGGDETRLTTAEGLDDGPDYSPDGAFIYFNSVRTGEMQIWRMKPDGSAQEQITNDEFNNWFPHPSPDGKWIVFLSFEKDVVGHPENKNVTLRLMSLADKKITVLAKLFGGQGTLNVPSWSPDSQHVAFVSYQLLP